RAGPFPARVSDVPAIGRAVVDEDAFGASHLARGQADSTVVVHGFQHVRHEGAEGSVGRKIGRDLGGRSAEDGIAEVAQGQNSHGDTLSDTYWVHDDA